MGIVETIALTMGVAWASGINLYATIAVLGLLGSSGNIALPPELAVLTDPVVIAAACFMYFIEFFADKTPGVDTGWDTIHTFIRIPAGAILAAGAVGDVNPAIQLAAGILGGALAAGAHATKAGGRVMLNTSPEPFSNWVASITEDVLVIGGLWTALHYPIVFLAGLGLMIALMVWLLPKIWRGINRIIDRLRQLLRPDDERVRRAGRDYSPVLRESAALPSVTREPSDPGPT